MKPESAVKLERQWGWLVFPVHKWLFKTTRGKIGGKFEGRPMLLLLHVGRKSGEKRETLIQYYPNGDDMVIVGSNGGRDKHPAWLHNVRANPDVEVEVNGKRQRAQAHVLDGAERDALWPKLTEWYPGYAHYQTLTDRQIQLVALTPKP
ncbi:MAG: nitroreductase family deazaflavin-dependent oxidoreductase [Actinomycetes bacterium]